ncbi:tripartite-type tricarboxylate transporter receptor subunit TctC [Variovorax paradoxus]|uniref:Tripartite-type tricarboxylate transporter receptor subunit TctC n=1 Tax=Variovorax paradoxus TaxID=34073 RepID=A0AAW8E984_VARPD|nr:tripartite tricarboxylate transporter substrate-binding protein [Variovorax paradoxus]MDP9968854.1 tripartite-type tricarboxylate transporter receptor subunit TctC [Variovorax paradoxus]
MKRRTLGAAAAASALTAIAGPVLAQIKPDSTSAWPARPVRLLVGFPAGSSPDVAARALADALATALGQAMIVDNKAGASGNIAAQQVAQAKDDHTLGVVINGNLTTAKTLNPKLPFDPATDFTLLSLLVSAPLVLVAPASSPSGAAFFASATQNGDKWNYGSVGNGSVGHLGMELLKSKVKGLNPVHIPFKGNPEVVTALISRDIQMALVPPGLVMPHIKSGKLQAIGLSTGRSALVPDVPSLTEVGVRDFNLEVWAALVGPATLSKAAQDRLNAEVHRVMRTEATRQRLFIQGWQAVGTSPEGLRSRVKEEAAVMGRVISQAGIKLD